MTFNSLQDIVVSVAEAIRPSERLSIVEAAEKYVKLSNPGAYKGPFRIDATPYLREPMEMLQSEDHRGVIFVGPSQCAKSTVGEMWLAHTVKCDPADMMGVYMTMIEARDFKKRRVDKLFRESPEIALMKTPGRNNDNTYDISFRSGMLFTLAWPTISALSGKPIPRLWLCDYDRFPQDIDGEGSPYALAQARTTTFLRNGMVLAEASPGFDIDDPKWVERKRSLHEAPPAEGIVALYNQGDRRRWYWQCPSCHEAFEPSRDHLRWPNSDDISECAEGAFMCCPHCGHVITEQGDKNGPGKKELNMKGKWLRDGQKWLPSGEVIGRGQNSDIASYMLFGPAAAFQTWRNLVSNLLNAEENYSKNGDDKALKTCLNTGFGEVYCPKSAQSSRLPDDLRARARDGGTRVVPPNVRFLVACADIQKDRYEVQVHGVDCFNDKHIIDRFQITKSQRMDKDGHPYRVSPHTHQEDWELIYYNILQKTYPLDDDTGRIMGIHHVAVDSQGIDGVTERAYNFWRWLRDDPDVDPRSHLRVSLVRGAKNRQAPRVSVIYPDAQSKNKKIIWSRGDVPVLQINTDMVKDQVSASLDRLEPGGGYVHFPNWLDKWFYNEMTAEIRTVKGWENPKRLRNESWDLLVYCEAICISDKIDLKSINWEKPPLWAEDWDFNSLVFGSIEERIVAKKESKKYSLSKLAEDLA